MADVHKDMQFIKARNEEVTEAIIRAATKGMKEADNTVTSVLNSLFTPMTRKRVKELGLGEEEETKYVTRLSCELENSGREASIATGKFISAVFHPTLTCLFHQAVLHIISLYTNTMRHFLGMRRSTSGL